MRAAAARFERDRSHVSLLDRDPELAAAVPPEEYATARPVLAGELVRVTDGAGSNVASLMGASDTWGLYVLSGVVIRTVSMGRATVPEVIGSGHLLGPPARMDSVLAVHEDLVAIEATDVVILGERAARAISHWPALLVIWQRRESVRRVRAATLGVVAQLANVEVRLLAVLWHLAEDWGVVGAQGTTLAFPLTHETLGRFVGAQRPTVSLALKRLHHEGLVRRLQNGSWLLAPGSDELLRCTIAADLPLTGPTAQAGVTHARANGHGPAAESRRRARELVEAAAALQAEAAQIQRRARQKRFDR
jgi:hypothetical protein